MIHWLCRSGERKKWWKQKNKVFSSLVFWFTFVFEVMFSDALLINQMPPKYWFISVQWAQKLISIYFYLEIPEIRLLSKDLRAIASKRLLSRSINVTMWLLVEMVRAKVISFLPFSLCWAMNSRIYDPSNAKRFYMKVLARVCYPHMWKSFSTIRTIEFR